MQVHLTETHRLQGTQWTERAEPMSPQSPSARSHLPWAGLSALTSLG